MTTADISGIRSKSGIESARNSKAEEVSLSKTGASASVHDSVQISSTASQLVGLQTELESVEIVDMARVEEIRNAIANGTYSPEPQKIAEALLAFESELSGS